MGSPAVDRQNVHGCTSHTEVNSMTETPRVWIDTLPDIELGYIFDYLHWRDKLNMLKAIPDMFRVINSSLGWRSFQAGEKQNAGCQQEELFCIQKYGNFFQHCTLWLGKPCRNNWECSCLNDSLNMDSMFPVLEALAENCKLLKSLRLYHPTHVVPQSCDTEIFKQYQQSIERLILHAVQKNNFSLELCGLQYSHDHVRPISLRFLDYYTSNPQFLQLVKVLDISRITDRTRRLQTPTPLVCLKSMVSLYTLKVPIHCINMATIQSLVLNQLTDLYLVNDDSTIDHEFEEQEHIHWDHLSLPKGSNFSVHYIFKQRIIYPHNLNVNPYVKSVCIDSPCKPLTDELLMAVADIYANSLKLFGIIQSSWKLDVNICDLSQFAAKCRQLTHFLSTVALPGALLMTLVHNAPCLKHLLIVAPEGEDFDEIVSKMSQFLRREWQPHTSPATFCVDICELPFILDEFVLRGY